MMVLEAMRELELGWLDREVELLDYSWELRQQGARVEPHSTQD